MKHWLLKLQTLLSESGPHFSVVATTVIRTRGSSPREIGATMLTSPEQHYGTIGGGQLEYQCQQLAREMLNQDAPNSRAVRSFSLGSQCGQCCGGVVEVLFEHFTSALPNWAVEAIERYNLEEDLWFVRALPVETNGAFHTAEAIGFVTVNGSIQHPDFHSDADQNLLHQMANTNGSFLCLTSQVREHTTRWFAERLSAPALKIAVFGAGHVGQALVECLTTLDAHIIWVDNREEYCASDPRHNVDKVFAKDPSQLVTNLPKDTLVLVMTHDHATDYAICNQVLTQTEIAFCGLIGSASKRKRYLRLAKQVGVTTSQLERLVCPIGIEGITGKRPAEIAISVCAQLMQYQEQQRTVQEPPLAALSH